MCKSLCSERTGAKLVSYILERYIGLKEQPGNSQTSSKILVWVKKYFKNVLDDGDVAWCSIGLKEAALEIGLDFPNVSPLAISWQTAGQSVQLEDAKLGNVVITTRKGGNHVGLFIRHSATYGSVFLLGFNQDNSCSIKEYQAKSIVKIVSIDHKQVAV